MTTQTLTTEEALRGVLAERLKILRGSRQVNQHVVAEAAGCTQPALSMYERGLRTPTLRTMVNISRFFGVSIDDLVDGA